MTERGEANDTAAKSPRRSVRIVANLIVIALCLLMVEAGFYFVLLPS